MRELSQRLCAMAALGFFSAAACAQEGGAAAEPAQDPNRAAGTKQVVRYSAGDSIPLGQPVRALPAGAVRYSAGDSIALGYAPPVRARNAAAAVPASQTEGGGYSQASALPLAGALVDSVSTHIGLHQPGLAEKNGLVRTSAAGLLGLFVIKAGIVYYFEHQPAEIRKPGLKATAGVWNGVAMNNLLLIAGASNPVSILGGALFGVFMYQQEGQILEKQDLARRSSAQPR